MVAVSALLAGTVVSPRDSASISPRDVSPRRFLTAGEEGHLAALGCTSFVPSRRSMRSRQSSYGSMLTSPRVTPGRTPRDKIESPEQVGHMSARGKPSTANNVSAAVVCSILEADGNPVAHDRLVNQVAELQRECEQLRAVGQEQNLRIASTAAQVATYDRGCAGLSASIQQLLHQLAQTDQEAVKTRAAGIALEHEGEQLRVQLAIAGRGQQSLKDSVSVAQHAAGDACSDHARLERDSRDASGELLVMKAELDAAADELKAVETDRVATTATLECNLAASRELAKERTAEAACALSEAWSAATEVAEARQTLAAMQQRVVEQHNQPLDMATQTGVTMEGHDLPEAADILQHARSEAILCQTQRSGLNESECLLQYQVSLERQLQCNDSIAAKRSRLELLELEEQRAADAAEHEKQLRHMQTKAESVQSKLQAELKHAQGVVSKSQESLSAIRAQLSELHKLGDSVQVSKQIAEASENELDLKLARQRASHGEILQRLWAVQVEQEEMLLRSNAASASSKERHTAAERRLRNLVLEVEELKHQKIERTLAAAAEENHRRSVERRLRRELLDIEQEWEFQRDELESRSASLANQTVQLHDERHAAEADLEETQVVLKAALGAHADADQCYASELQAARQRARSAEREPQRVLADLQSEAEELRAEHGRTRGSIKRLEALNAGLKAQVHVLQHQYAEGMGCAPGSIATANSAGSLSLASSSITSPFRLTAATSTGALTQSSTAPGRGSAPPASSGLMQLLSGHQLS